MESNIAPLISVIVPVYNVENYVDRCIDSVLNQSYLNLEILLIDDGSTDRSGSICNEYKEKDDRIKCIHKKNGGLSDSRNMGILYAKGQYITFVDGDDFIADDYIEYLYFLISKYNADISICNYQKVIADGDIMNKKNGKTIVLLGDEALEVLFYQKYYTMSAWGKLYKKEIIQGIEFPVGMVHEDVGTVYKYFGNSQKTVYGFEKKYGYVQREKSIINSKFELHKMSYIKFTKEIIKYVESQKKELYSAAISRHFSACFQVIVQINQDEDMFGGIYNELINEINIHKKIVFNDSKARKVNRIAAAMAIINCKGTINLIKFIKTNKLF